MQPTCSNILRDTYVERTQRSPRYSLRAFARDLGLSPGGLHQVLNGRKPLSVARAAQLAKRLRLEGPAYEKFVLAAQIEKASDPEHRELLLERLRQLEPESKHTQLSIDQFRVISDWYHFAIYESLDLNLKDFTPKKLSQRLGITLVEVREAIERLERLEFIVRDADGTPKKNKHHLLIDSATPSEAIRKAYRQVIDKGEQAITSQSPREKVIGIETFALDPQQIPELKELTDRYFDQVLELAARGKKRTEIYQAFVEVFRLTETSKNPSPNLPNHKGGSNA
jgi:uncharacterized protein (TIGR02147 family)